MKTTVLLLVSFTSLVACTAGTVDDVDDVDDDVIDMSGPSSPEAEEGVVHHEDEEDPLVPYSHTCYWSYGWCFDGEGIPVVSLRWGCEYNDVYNIYYCGG